MAMATDVKPSKLIRRISSDWNKMGGKQFQFKELQPFERMTILTLFNIFMATNKKTLISKLRMMLTLSLQQFKTMNLQSSLVWMRSLC
jgi:hypothetical protein